MGNGYAEITLHEKKVGLKFGMDCLEFIQDKAQEVQIVKGETVTKAGMVYILYFGYKNWCIVKEQQPEFSYEEFYDYVENVLFAKADNKELVAAITAFSNSKVVKGGDNTAAENPEKKKKSSLKS